MQMKCKTRTVNSCCGFAKANRSTRRHMPTTAPYTKHVFVISASSHRPAGAEINISLFHMALNRLSICFPYLSECHLGKSIMQIQHQDESIICQWIKKMISLNCSMAERCIRSADLILVWLPLYTNKNVHLIIELEI